MNITQEFKIEIVRVTDESEVQVAPHFCAAVTEWEREFDDSNEIEDDEDQSDDADENDQDDSEPDDFVIDTADSTVYLTAKVNAAVLSDFRDLTSSNSNDDYKLRVIYGDDQQTGKIVREFDISCDARMLLSQGQKDGVSPARDLEVLFAFDCYDENFMF